MASAILNTLRLMRAGLVLAQHGVEFVPKGMRVPWGLHVLRVLTLPVRILSWPFRIGQPKEKRISNALASLGPSYIKLGQFLATRADVIGPDLARDLSHLQDKLPPFSMKAAKLAVEESLGQPLEQCFEEFGPPVAAASIAQVHKAAVWSDGPHHQVAVKILRPGIERRFKRDLNSYYFAAKQVERYHEPSRRLRPVAVVETLERTTEIEMDLRLEGAAISEMAENIKDDVGFRVPGVDWRRTQKRVLTTEWIDGVPIWDQDRLKAAGFNLRDLGLTVLRAFLRHAMRDGFFHADMHQGNLLVQGNGTVVAVDFGIMGRLSPLEQRFLAEILYGLITRDYRRAAAIHFEAGYVPPHHSVETFAQAMRAIGEPIHGRTADEISMADLLGQLFAYTDVFDMETRPELILLQKSMVIVEGVARSLDPELNVWTAAEPIAQDWIEENMGAKGLLRDARKSVMTLGRGVSDLPTIAAQAQRTLAAFHEMSREGIRLDEDTVKRIAQEREKARWPKLLFWALPVFVLLWLAYVLLEAYVRPWLT